MTDASTTPSTDPRPDSSVSKYKEDDTTLSHDDLVYASAELSFSDDEDWVLSLLSSQLPEKIKQSTQKKAEKKPEKKPENNVPPRILEDEDEIHIPAIFLTQGAKNTRLLRQGEEIKRQMTEDEKRMKAQAEELARLRNKVLSELNDNGTQFVYSLKNDAELVEKYVQKYYFKDQTAMTQRHFFYFSNITNVKIESPVNETLSLLFTEMVSLLDARNHANLLQILERNGITIDTLVNYALVNIKNETVLDLVESFVYYVSTEHKETSGGVSSTNSQAGLTIDKYMEGLGAYQGSDLPLKLVHYNNSPRLTILRLCIVFHYKLMSKEEIELAITHFLLSISDFILNKREKSLLLERFVRPVFERLVSTCGDIDEVSLLIEDLLDLLKTHIYGEETQVLLKDHEIQFNILSALWTVFHKHKGDAGKVVTGLVLDYLKFTNNDDVSYSVLKMANVITKIGETKVTSSNTSNIYKNAFRAQLTTSMLTNLINDQQVKHKQDYFLLRQQLLDCKDHLQESIGKILFMKMDDVPLKASLSVALSETYHIIDHLSTVLDKNVVFLKRDLFYETN